MLEDKSGRSPAAAGANAPPPLAERPTRVRWVIFALCCGTSFILYLHRYTWGIIKADVQEEFGWTAAELGVLDSCFGATYAIGQVPSGILCDWFGPHVLLGSMLAVWSLAMAGVALAVGYTSMAAARLTFGLAQAGCYPTLSKVTKVWFPLSVRTSVQGWVATFFGRGGGAASFVIVGYVLIDRMGLSWRQALFAVTALGLVFAVLFVLLFRNTPAEHPAANPAEAELITEGNPEVQTATRSALRWPVLFRSGNMWVFFLQQFTSAFVDNVYPYWIPLFLLTAKNLEIGEAGLMAAAPLLGGAFGGMLGGMLQNWLILRTGNRRWSRSLVGLSGKLIATAFIFASLAVDDPLAVIVILSLVKFFSDWSQPTVWGTITDISGRNAASVFGAVNTCGSIASVVAGPTMGLIIMLFSQTHTARGAGPLAATEAVAVESGGSAVTQQYEPLGHFNIRGELTGTIRQGQQTLYRFRVSEAGEFAFEPLAAGGGPEPVAFACRLDRRRGEIRLRWTSEPPTYALVVDYEHVDYTGGWAMLFTVLGVIYLVSALSWLFIDCTKKLES